MGQELSSHQPIRTENHSANDLLSGKELDCRKIVLTQRGGDPPCVVSGAGYLKQDSSGRLVYKMFGAQFQNCPEAGQVWGATPPGRVYPDSSLFRLTAEDHFGHTWMADRVLLPPLPAFITGELNEVRATNNRTTRELAEPIDTADLTETLSLHFAGLADIEFNSLTIDGSMVRQLSDQDEAYREKYEDSGSRLNVLRFARRDVEIDIVQHTGYFSVYARTGEKFEPNFHVRLQEGLQFVLGHTPNCRSIELVSNDIRETRVFSAGEDFGATRFKPPLDRNSYCNHTGEFTVLLINKFLDYIGENTSANWHPLSIRIHHAIAAGASSVEAFALGLAVAVEGICDQLFPDVAALSECYTEALDSLGSHIESWSQSMAEDENLRLAAKQIVNRVEGSLAHYRAVDANMRMRRHVELGDVSEPLVVAWKKMRPKAAHGSLFDPDDSQRFIDRWHAMNVLLYQLVFRAIGYEGPYSDYSEHGFRPKMYQANNSIGNGRPEGGTR